MENGDWTLIESDPGVFTELVHSFGAKDLEVEEVWDLESYNGSNSSEIYGFIFLFKWDPAMTDHRMTIPWDNLPNVFFAKQVINNACATQAILSILLNLPSSVEIGEELTQFKQFTAQFDPELKGLSITNSETIRTVHNSFTRADPFVNEMPVPEKESEDNFHFVAYVPVDGRIYELDGLKSGPIEVGQYDPQKRSTWSQQLVPVIQSRIAQFATTEIRFNLMALIRSKQTVLHDQVQAIEEQLRNTSLAESARNHLEQEKYNLSNQLAIENDKMERYKRENERRRHNYIPFILELLQQMANVGDLEDASRRAVRR